MNLTQRVGLLLSGTMALSAWSPAWAADSNAINSNASSAEATAPQSEALHPSWPEPPKAPSGAPNVDAHL
jgi:hypothetical protein